MKIQCDNCNRIVNDNDTYSFEGNSFIYDILEFDMIKIKEYIMNAMQISDDKFEKIIKGLKKCSHTFCIKCFPYMEEWWDGLPNFTEEEENKLIFLKLFSILYFFKCKECIARNEKLENCECSSCDDFEQ